MFLSRQMGWDFEKGTAAGGFSLRDAGFSVASKTGFARLNWFKAFPVHEAIRHKPDPVFDSELRWLPAFQET